MELISIKDITEKIALDISKFMEANVVIIDNKLNRIADTYIYPHEQPEIRNNSIVGSIILTGKPLVIEDRRYFSTCINCPDVQVCNMGGIIGVPIFLNDQVIGALALISAPSGINEYFKNLSHTLDYLEKMAEVISCKLQVEENRKRIRYMLLKEKLLINSVNDAIAIVDEKGYLVRYNAIFSIRFFDKKNPINKHIDELVEHHIIKTFLKTKNSFNEKLIYLEVNGKGQNYLCSARKISAGNKYYGAIFTFRDIIQNESLVKNKICKKPLQKAMDNFFGKSISMVKARQKVQEAIDSDASVLIKGSSINTHELSCLIHFYSTRKDYNFIAIDCEDNTVEQELFDEADIVNKLRLANKGTLCLKSVDSMPLYLQSKLDAFLSSKVINTCDGEFSINTRLIATTTEDLEQLAEQGYFLKSLYEKISWECIVIPEITDNPEDIMHYLCKCLKHYGDKYGRNNISIDENAIHALCNYDWPGGSKQLTKTIEYLIKESKDNLITMETLNYLPWQMTKADKYKTIEKQNAEVIREMIRKGKTRDEIAQILGIGRATLFRWLKKYNIVQY